MALQPLFIRGWKQLSAYFFRYYISDLVSRGLPCWLSHYLLYSFVCKKINLFMTTYIIIFVLLLVAELVYFRIADKCNIIDKPNQRSSHSTIVLRGGGIIFMIGA